MTNGMFMNLHGNYTTSSHTEDYALVQVTNSNLTKMKKNDII